MDNIQKKIGRIRTPRVQITYDLETNGAKVVKKLPYVLAILADVCGDSEKRSLYKDRRFIDLTMSNLANVMTHLDVRVKLLLKAYRGENTSTKQINLQLFGIEDFHPDNIINNLDFLLNLKNIMMYMRDLRRKLTSNEMCMNGFLNMLKNPISVGYGDRSNFSTGENKIDPQDPANSFAAGKQKK